jgi:hypothetical protein
LTSYRRAANHYIAGLAVACLIVLPYVGAGAIVVWALTAVAIHALAPRRRG